jgi:hypothetical protein
MINHISIQTGGHSIFLLTLNFLSISNLKKNKNHTDWNIVESGVKHHKPNPESVIV